MLIVPFIDEENLGSEKLSNVCCYLDHSGRIEIGIQAYLIFFHFIFYCSFEAEREAKTGANTQSKMVVGEG